MPRPAGPQVRHSPYRGLMHCVAQTFREEGLAAFYKSYWTTVRPRGAVWWVWVAQRSLTAGDGW